MSLPCIVSVFAFASLLASSCALPTPRALPKIGLTRLPCTTWSSSSRGLMMASLADVQPVFEAQLPSSEVLYGFSLLLGLLVFTSFYWWTVVIPQARTKLAISKSRGEVKNMLDELRDDVSTTTINNIQEGVLLAQVVDAAEEGQGNEGPRASSTNHKSFDRAFKQWLFTDWLEKRKGSDKPAAIPLLKKAKWNSGDNPVLVAFGGIFSLVLAASLFERISISISG